MPWPGKNRLPKTPEDYRAAVAMWNEGLSAREIGKAFQVSEDTVYGWSRFYSWPSRRRITGGLMLQEPDPTPEEIAAGAAEVRKRWSEAEEQKRAVGGRRQVAEVQVVSATILAPRRKGVRTT